jgi:hypothetical protein
MHKAYTFRAFRQIEGFSGRLIDNPLPTGWRDTAVMSECLAHLVVIATKPTPKRGSPRSRIN